MERVRAEGTEKAAGIAEGRRELQRGGGEKRSGGVQPPVGALRKRPSVPSRRKGSELEWLIRIETRFCGGHDARGGAIRRALGKRPNQCVGPFCL